MRLPSFYGRRGGVTNVYRRRRYALDASVLVELLAGSPVARRLAEDLAGGRIEAYAARLSLTEAFYVTCRLWGREKAEERLNLLIDSGVVEIVEDERLWEYAGDCKCRIPIALGDCYTLATAKLYAAKPLFLRPERELVENISRVRDWLRDTPEFLTG